MVDKKIEEDESRLSTSTRILANLARRAQEPATGQIKSRGSGRFASSRQGNDVDPVARFTGFAAATGTARSLGAKEDARIRSGVGAEEKRLDRLAEDKAQESSIADVQSKIKRRLEQTEGEAEGRSLGRERFEAGRKQFNVTEERLSSGAKTQEQLNQLKISEKEIDVIQKLNLPISKESPVGRSFGLSEDVPVAAKDLTRRETAQINVLEDSISDLREKEKTFDGLDDADKARLLRVTNEKRAIVGLQPVTLEGSGEAEPDISTPTPTSTPIPQDQRDIIKRALIEQRNKRLGL